VSAFTATPNPATVNQAVAISLALANTGSAPASVTGVSPQVSPPKMTCTGVTPAPPQIIPAGGSMAFGWTCSSSTARSYNLAATVTAADAISGANISPTVPGISLTVVK
jgi:phage-related minor tail protein